MKRVLLTGASGLIGRHCLRRLQQEACEIHAVNRAGIGPEGDNIQWHAADLREPLSARAIVERVYPTHLLHLAWEATPRLYASSPENLAWLQATIAMASGFGQAGGIRFVGVGSSAEYDPINRACHEDLTPIRPATIYGKCKAACWLGLMAAAQHHRFGAVWGRVFLPYGPGDSPLRLIPSVLTALDKRRPVETTHGRQLRDFIYLPDLADLMVRLLFSDETGVFNLGTGVATTIASVIEHLAARRGGLDLVRFGAIAPPFGEPPVLVADMSKVTARLGWSPSMAIETGLDLVLASHLQTPSACD